MRKPAFLLLALMGAFALIFFWRAAAPVPAPDSAIESPAPARPQSATSESSAAPPVALADAQPTMNVSEELDRILTATELSNDQAARALARLVMRRESSVETRLEALQHLLNLSVEAHEKHLLPLLADTNLPAELGNTILNDSLNGPLRWQATACLAVLTHQRNTEMRQQAREHLEFLTEQSHGSDVVAWTRAVEAAAAGWPQVDAVTSSPATTP